MSVLGGLILMIADAIQRFQQESLGVFVDEASVLVDKLQKWLSMFGIHLEGAAILEAIKQQISVPFLVQTTVTVVVDGVGNALLVLLLVLYLLAEASAHAPGSLRAKVDDQIQRWVTQTATATDADDAGVHRLRIERWNIATKQVTRPLQSRLPLQVHRHQDDHIRVPGPGRVPHHGHGAARAHGALVR